MKPFDRGIYLLPNLMTTAALFAGFYAVIAGIQGNFEMGAIAIFIAMVFDGLDGRIARMTNSCSAFGAEYDSLADMVSFGLAPAILVFQWALMDFGKLGWLVAFIYTVGAALRLARFNTQVATADKRYFQGLPSPAAAALLAGLIWMVESNQIELAIMPLVALGLTLFAGIMMVSNVRFSSFKELKLKDKVPFVTLLVVVLVFVVVTLKPAMILFLFFLVYAFSGPVMTLMLLRKKRADRKMHKAESDDVGVVDSDKSSQVSQSNAESGAAQADNDEIEAKSPPVSEK
ncbi:CDP-diacylglycerol--serine O-phosphatidyltransferase [Thiomicrorhabdus sediminis]|uniref:CDP-diacylglycerol--serine O-phosphatidyltransferase n=1 Tax=Thiomicrorhabdus sediminis TaxID=2580412 RepID=A0A4P9K806_9GAMM|nr:CDP-diacylglycerol--serine O-phosphatidyltransferase [Thiomicrorhabdus sediminis]QCU90600.1 CDP-diacylglycerol--serine O-phosphatidyltransferase [Thiomicrorhabdus sediminis]